MQITSRDNRLVKEVRRLLADARYRRTSGRMALEGARLCTDAVRSGIRLETVLYTPRAARQYPEMVEMLLGNCRESAEITEPLAGYIGDTASPQGIFGIAGIPAGIRPLDNDGVFAKINKNGRYIALEDIQDPANLGTIIRTAEAMRLDGMLLSSGCCDLFSPKVLRGSMGGVFRLPFFLPADFRGILTRLGAGGMTCWACVVDGEAEPLPGTALGDGCLCVIGNEGNGLRPQTVQACTGRLTIRMPGRAESLNASTAAVLVMWEMVRGSL